MDSYLGMSQSNSTDDLSRNWLPTKMGSHTAHNAINELVHKLKTQNEKPVCFISCFGLLSSVPSALGSLPVIFSSPCGWTSQRLPSNVTDAGDQDHTQEHWGAYSAGITHSAYTCQTRVIGHWAITLTRKSSSPYLGTFASQLPENKKISRTMYGIAPLNLLEWFWFLKFSVI